MERAARPILIPVLLLASAIHAQTLTSALVTASRCAGLQASPMVRVWARNFANVLATDLNQNPASIAAGAGMIDSSQGEMGPILLEHTHTIGQGQINVNAPVQPSLLTADDGMDLSHLSGPGDIVLQPTEGPTVAAQLDYDIDIRLWAIAPSITYGVTDRLDLSALLPIVHLAADITGMNRPVQALSTTGQFEPIPRSERTTIRSRQVLSVLGVGDLNIRARYQIHPAWAATLAVQFPTGNPDNGLGTGDYWMSPKLVGTLGLFHHRAEVNWNIGLNLDLNTIDASEVAYGVGLAARLWPDWAGVVEFLGRSQLGANVFALDTGTLYLLPTGVLDSRSFLGMEFGRRDFFTLAFGLRGRLPLGLVAFVAGVVPLNDAGFQARPVTPVMGIGATF